MTPKEYENAVLERFRTLFPPPRFRATPNIYRLGVKSKRKRQIDVCVFEHGRSDPGLIIEAKRHKRRIDLVHAGSTISLVRDVGGGVPAIMVASSDFSRGALNFLTAEGIGHLTITLAEARGLNWVPVIERAFALDNQFREVSGHLVEALRFGRAEALLHETGLPYEEWLAVMNTTIGLFPKAATQVLFELARDHHEHAIRFNAIQLLDDAGYLTRTTISALLRTERDPDTLELLQMLSGE
jgi:hypothetical protein